MARRTSTAQIGQRTREGLVAKHPARGATRPPVVLCLTGARVVEWMVRERQGGATEWSSSGDSARAPSNDDVGEVGVQAEGVRPGVRRTARRQGRCLFRFYKKRYPT